MTPRLPLSAALLGAVALAMPLSAMAPPTALLPAPASAATADPGTPATADPGASDPGTRPGAPAAASASPSDPDFLFRAPAMTLTLRSGLFSHRAHGTFFDVTTRDFTADRSDFQSWDFGFEVAIAAGERLDVVVGIDGGSTQVAHESRDFEELDGTPIFQRTRIRRGPALQVGVRGYLLPRGEQLSTYAWVPSTVAPYVGAGLGYTGYGVRQWGDFVYEDAEGIWIVADDLNHDGTSGIAWASAGADVALNSRLALTLEGRYQWGEDPMGQDFRITDPLDLSGLRLTAGLSVRF